MHLIINLQPLLSPLTGIGHYTRELTLELLAREDGKADPPMRLDGLTGSRREPLTPAHPLLGLASATPEAATVNGTAAGTLVWRLARRYLRNPLTRRAYRWLYTQRLKQGGAQHSALYWEPNYILLPWQGKSVVTVHDLSHQRYPECHPKERVDFFDRHLGESLRRATRINVVSEFTSRELQELHGVDPARIDIVPPAVAERFFEAPAAPQVAGLVARYQLPPRYLLSVGTLEPRKNLARVLEAFASLPEQQRNATPLLLAGMSGWGEQQLSGRVNAAMREGSIRRLGYVPADDLPALYHLAAGFVYVSLYEGFGMPVLEAMAAGTPVLTANVTATSEVAAGAAIEVDPMDPDAIRHGIARLAEGDHDQAIQLGRQRARQFSWQRSGDLLLESFHQALNS